MASLQRLSEPPVIALYNESRTARLEKVTVVGVEDPYPGRADLRRAAGGCAPAVILPHGPGIFPRR